MKRTVLLAGMFAVAVTTPAIAEVQLNGSIVFTSVSRGCVTYEAIVKMEHAEAGNNLTLAGRPMPIQTREVRCECLSNANGRQVSPVAKDSSGM